MSFQLSLKRAAMRRKRGRGQNIAGEQQTVSAAFGAGDDSEGSEEAPATQRITTIAARIDEEPDMKTPQIHEEEHMEHHDEKKSTTKASQIASIIERRRKANVAPTVLREQRDEALFRYEVANCPDEADSHLYEERPVDGFGEMMLRGMGWKGKETLEENPEPPVPRPNRLGLGAKPSALKQPIRRKRLREVENKISSAPDRDTTENGTSEEGFTVDSKSTRLEFNHRPDSKRPKA